MKRMGDADWFAFFPFPLCLRCPRVVAVFEPSDCLGATESQMVNGEDLLWLDARCGDLHLTLLAPHTHTCFCHSEHFTETVEERVGSSFFHIYAKWPVAFVCAAIKSE